MFKDDLLQELLEDLTTVVATLLVGLLVVNFIVRPVVVDGNSMNPTLKDGTYGFTSLISRRLNKIDRFDIVVIHIAKEHDLVKRVIALPNETIEFKDDELYINGVLVEQTGFSLASDAKTDDFGPITLKEDEYFCLGDNRLHSADSRTYGAFSLDDIYSVGFFGFWPFSEFGGKK